MPPDRCHITDVADLDVSFSDGIPVIPVTLEGHPLHMLVDTEASNAVITPDAARSIGVFDDYAIARFDGLNGSVTGPVAVTQILSFGRVDATSESFLINKIDSHVRAGELPIDGLIGNDILQHFDVALDFPDHELSLYLPGIARGFCRRGLLALVSFRLPSPIMAVRNFLS